MLRKFVINYLLRHQHPVNQALHVIGVPLTFVATAVLLWEGFATWACGTFVAGYLLQFAGHWIEGNDAGEAIVLKRALGIPYVDIVPRPVSVKE
jgi:uncharacterized membrane protein YGL010W